MTMTEWELFFNGKPEKILLLFFSALAVTAGQMSRGRPEIFLMIKLAAHVLESEFNIEYEFVRGKTFLCLFTVNDDPNFEAMAGDSLVPVVLREARDSNLRSPEPEPPPSLLTTKVWLVMVSMMGELVKIVTCRSPWTPGLPERRWICIEPPPLHHSPIAAAKIM